MLEVGLGYGTVGQKVAESGARYTGLDIAKGPVDGLNHRLAQSGLPGRALQGSILEPPFNRATFDVVVAIGVYHHTGNLQLALANTAALLRPQGRAVIMIYNAGNYVRMILDPLGTINHLARGGIEICERRNKGTFRQERRGRGRATDGFPFTWHVSRDAAEEFQNGQRINRERHCTSAVSVYPARIHVRYHR